MNLTATIVLAAAAAFNVTPAQVSTLAAPMPQVQTVEEYVRDYFADEPILAEVASCESHFRQFDSNGNVLKNANSSAIGIMQIMASVHSETAAELGLDPTTMQGNLAYAKYLYDKNGLSPWNASKACWSKSQAYKDLQSAQAKLAINKN
ncbi:MAG TPA: transglycosylase SLT domain-containing protein [Candidatus Paceibacterota bacterium]|nr:transglycosylase SLT domain-containing protein [Candidatus Paceibacterota bacterium]